MTDFGYTVLGFGSGSSPSGDPLLNGLEAWWSLDEASGVRTDSHNSIALTDNNTVGSAVGKQGNCTQSLGDEYLNIPTVPPANLLFADESFTFCGWVYFQGSVQGYNPIITCRQAGSASTVMYQLVVYDIDQDPAIGTDYAVYMSVSNGTTMNTCYSGNLSPALGAWHFILGEHDADADEIRITINNGTPSIQVHTAGCFTTNTNTRFYIGQFHDLTGESYYAFGGLGTYHYMDEVAVWRRILTSEEKTRLYNSGSGMGYPG